MSKLVVKNLSSLGEWDRTRVSFAVQGANIILKSTQFLEAVLDAKLTETNGLTNNQVYSCIMRADQLNPLDKPDELDIQLTLYRKSFSRVVGYTFSNQLTIWVNRKYFGSAKSIASNLVHEASHQLGFTHNGVWATSVPYVLNRIIEKLWDTMPEVQAVDKKYWEWWNS